jgi:hypothetical protein
MTLPAYSPVEAAPAIRYLSSIFVGYGCEPFDIKSKVVRKRKIKKSRTDGEVSHPFALKCKVTSLPISRVVASMVWPSLPRRRLVSQE